MSHGPVGGANATGGSRTVLVTGASGFVGSHICAEMTAAGWRVRAAVRGTSSRRWIEHLPIEYAITDLSSESDLATACEGCDAVIHCAGVTNAVRAESYFAVNTRSTERLWLAAERAGLSRFLLVSSLAAAGPSRTREPQDESAEPHPINVYGRSKLEAERFLLAQGGPMTALVVRPPAVYGPHDEDGLTMIQAAARGILPLPLAGERRLVMVYATDLARGIRLALERGTRRGVYYLTDGNVYTLPEVGRALGLALGRSVTMIPIPRTVLRVAALFGEVAGRLTGAPFTLNLERVKQLDRDGWVASDALARRELGYHSEYDVVRGMEETVRWCRSMKWI